LAVIFFAFLFYLSNKKEIKVKKFFTNKIHGIKEEKEIRICLEIINKTGQDLDNIVLEDFVQPVFKLEKEFYGVKPNKIVKIGSEEKLVWEIPKLGPKETRVFMYKIIPKIGLSEKYSFSLARVKYKKDQISRVLFSNSLATVGD
jgi:CRISPR/Cas system-associated protein Cas5 (RAMP superfamily)